MDKRVRIGLIFSYNEKWIAGAYYILNLIHALKLLDDKAKPHLVILSAKNEDFEKIKPIEYPYIEYQYLDKNEIKITYPLFYRIMNKVFRLSGINKTLYKKPLLDIKNFSLNAVFPAIDEPFFQPVNQKIFWIPDFQEHFLPHFFSDKEIVFRKQQQQKLVNQKETIVFSSYNAQQHFKQIYPKAQNKIELLQFAVTHINYKQLNEKEVLKKYNIETPYFFCSNQFWAHKNHHVILRALKKLKDNNEKVLVVFSGKQEDYRNPDFFNTLTSYIDEHGLNDYVRFLGFIARDEQLLLMEKAVAVIQPSLFEGWSTVVEDVKAMNQYIVLSKLRVHLEQMKTNVTFFDPEKDQELAQIMFQLKKEKPKKELSNYKLKQIQFAKDFMNIVKTTK